MTADDKRESAPRRVERSPEAERQQVEWEMDRLVTLMGHYLAGEVGPSAYEDPRFREWLTEEFSSRREGLASRTVERLRDRILRRAAALRMGVRCVDTGAPVRLAGVTGRLAEIVDTAAEERAGPKLPQAVAAGAGRDLWEEECEQWVELPPEVPSGRFIALDVAGESMTPLIHPGDVVLVRLGARVARDSVVVARHPDDGYIVKRVGRVGRQEIELLSLNPQFPAIRVPRDERSIVGTVVLRWCAHGGSLPR